MHYYGSLRVSDYVTLKRYNKEMFKLTYYKTPTMQKGFEIRKKKRRVRGVNGSKLDNNISRARNKVYEYAICNDFQYFVTLTIDGKKYDRMDLGTYYKDFSQFLRNYNRNHKTKVKYLLIPEKHKDGAWHMHGLIKGIPGKHLVKNEYGYLDWKHYRDRFGWISLAPIRSTERVSKYITKYISKDLSRSITELNAKMYYSSKGLKVAEEIRRGTLCADNVPYDFENDYVKIKWFNDDSIANSIID